MTKKKLMSISWNDFDILLGEFVSKVEMIERDFKYVTGIPRGGLPHAVALSHYLDIPYVEYSEVLQRSFSMNNIIIVDDIHDTGLTIKKFTDMSSMIKQIDWDTNLFATLHIKEEYEGPAQLVYVEKAPKDRWINYPWELEVKYD